MALITPVDDEPGLAGVLAHRPDLSERYARFYEEMWRNPSVPSRVLQLCQARIAQIHDCPVEFDSPDERRGLDAGDLDALAGGDLKYFSEPEQAALELAELMPYGHHSVTDEHVRRADAAFGHGGCVTLLTALAFFDVQCRLRLTLEMG